MKRKVVLITLAMLLGVGLAASGCAKSEPAGEPAPPPTEVITWRCDFAIDAEREDYKNVEHFWDCVNERAEGKLKVELYPSHALGHASADLLRVVGDNTIEACMMGLSYVTRDAPVIAYMIPQMGGRSRKATAALYDICPPFFEKEFAKWNLKHLVMTAMSTCNIVLIAKDPCNSLELMEPMKLRAWSKEQVDSFGALGISFEVLPQSELYMALKTGVFDGAIFVPDAVLTQSMYEVCDYVTALVPYNSHCCMVASEAAWEALPTDVQDIIDECAEEYVQWRLDSFDICPDDALFEQMEEKGMTVLPPWPEADFEAFLATNRAWWKEALLATGGDSATYYEAILPVLDK